MLLDQRDPPADEVGLLDPRDQERYRRLLDSQLWAVLRTALLAERDALFDEEASTNQALWENRGAIKWVSRWLRSGPYLMVQYLRQQENAR